MTDEEHEKLLPECMKKFADLRETQIGMEADLKHIKGRIDNGMSKTLDEIRSCFLEFKGKIAHNTDVVNRIEDIGWWMIKILIAAVGLVILWAAANGWKLK